MNILVPHSWLLDHLNTSAKPEEIQRILSLCGPSVERIEKHGDEPVYDIEVTTNRMDTACVRGIAREASVILPQNGVPATLKNLPVFAELDEKRTQDIARFPIFIQNDAKLCPRIMAVTMKVTIGPSPTWLSNRLEASGVRSLNNLIDITNYVMLELGQPTHVFDADRLGSTMTIRESRKGETLITLDHRTHTLQGGDIVAENGAGELVDLIGIMGTANSVVMDNTINVLFFIEHCEPKHIRRTSMGLAVRTQAAQLNEKMLDINGLDRAMARGIQLFQELAQATLTSEVLDLYPTKKIQQHIQLPLTETKRYLGIELPILTQETILKDLGCDVSGSNETLDVVVPTSRPDLEIPVDLVEEIARVFGYHNLPSVLPATTIPTTYPEDVDFDKEHMMKEFLSTLGWQEVYTYSAISQAQVEKSGFDAKAHIRLANPLNDEHVYMRRSLFGSHEEVLANNPQRKELSIFELAQVYHPQEKDLPHEVLTLGLTSRKTWRQVRGDLEVLLRKFFILPEEIQTWQSSPESANLSIGDIKIGESTYSNGLFHLALDWKQLLKVAKRNPTYSPFCPFPPIREDLTFTIPEETKIGFVLQSMRENNPLISSVHLSDTYKLNYTFTIEYLNKESQITSKDVEPIRKGIIQMLDQTYQAKLVGHV